ncbi:FAD:protein FMN transferase [Fusibacter sp. JL216-2]|uniref:FAD:protein FMN transferase n=1 Tax=Fusibacter sp. JL216-2 TaxID=3071453 RepID=UPI003D33C5ED
MKKIMSISLALLLLLAGCTAQDKNTNTEKSTETGHQTQKQENHEKKDSYERSEFVLGTIVTVKLFEDGSEAILDKVFERMTEIENHMSFNSSQSEVISINDAAGKNPVQVSEDTYDVIDTAIKFASQSEGQFDPTIGPLVKLWGIGSEGAAVPSDRDREKALELTDWNEVELNGYEKSVYLKKEDMMLDLGAIAKGYASDEVVRILKEASVSRAIINLGGNVYAYGEKADGSPWRIGIQNPFSARGEYIGIIELKNKSVVTSGIYERFFEADGKKYHHLLNTETGFPIENELASVTIISESSINADAMSTILFSEGVEGGLAYLEKYHPEVDAVFITKDKDVYSTDLSEYEVKWTDASFEIN